MAICHNRIFMLWHVVVANQLFLHVTVAYYFLLRIVFGVVVFFFTWLLVPCGVCVTPVSPDCCYFWRFCWFHPPLTSEWGTLLCHITPFSVHCYCASRKYYYESGMSCIFKLKLIYVTGNHLYCCTSLYGTSHLSLCIVTACHGDITLSPVRCVYSNLYWYMSRVTIYIVVRCFVWFVCWVKW